MDFHTLAALGASIAKWEGNLVLTDLEDAKFGITDCPLCVLYWGNGCKGCPVYEDTGYHRCKDTPYYDALNAAEADDLPAFRAAAESEVQFLRDLLPASVAA